MRVLMVGLGGIGQRHLRNLRTLLGDNLEVLAYRVRRHSHTLTDQLSIEAQTGLEEKYRVQVYADLDEALARKPDAVFVCNPTSLHLPVALKAVRAGCHLFMEKPVADNLENIDELLRIIESQGLVSMVGYQLRFHPCLLQLHRLLQQGAIGRVLSVRAEVGEYLPAWHPYEDYRQMYAARRDLGGGVILSQIHEFDYLYWLFGMPRRLMTLGGKLSSLEIDVEDTASTLMECIVDKHVVPVHLHQDYVQRPPSRNCQVIGDAGKILVDLRNLTVQCFDGEGRLSDNFSCESFQRNQLFLDELKHFLACISRREQAQVSVRDGVQSLRMALAAKASLATGQIVELKGC
jgi:predicted dehydrogenase